MKKYLVTLTEHERAALGQRVSSGRGPAHELARKRFVEHGLEAALGRKRQDRPSRERTRDGRAEARLIALACSPPPDGRATNSPKDRTGMSPRPSCREPYGRKKNFHQENCPRTLAGATP